MTSMSHRYAMFPPRPPYDDMDFYSDSESDSDLGDAPSFGKWRYVDLLQGGAVELV